MKRYLIACTVAIGLAIILAVGGTYGATLYYTADHGSACADCHEMAEAVSAVHGSPHHNAACLDCHEAGLATKLRHIRVHLTGSAPEAIRLRDVDVEPMMTNCRKCHQQEYASWHGGPHSASFSEIFTSPTHNAKRRLMDDCFRCHGAYFDGAIRDLVQPQNLQGPWHFTHAEMAGQPAIPCQSCHWIHRRGASESRPAARVSVDGPVVRDSVAFYDRREQMHFAAATLSIPVLYDGARLLKISPDQRQALCYQCHAPRQPDTASTAAVNHWGPQAGSGDDRTPKGVHEGLSCFSCHNGHNESARASCATCHPQMSHCGIDVEKMDTSYANPSSSHNIHWVQCVDCHRNGVPKPKTAVAGR